MSLPVSIENDAWRLEVWPIVGGKVSSVIDKADGHELLFGFPVEIPTSAQYDIPYSKSWYAGWDELVPTVGPCQYAGFPYNGVAVPDHGEIWGLPTTAVPAKNGITTVWHGLRFGYRLARKLYLEDQRLIAEYTLFNLAPFEFRFVWAQHALLSMKSPIELDMPGMTQCRWSYDTAGQKIEKLFQWPLLADGEDMSRPNSLPAGRSWKLFGQFSITHPAMIRYPQRSRWLKMEFSTDEELRAYWGLWLNTGGWAGHRHLALQPTFGRFDQLDRCTVDESAARVGASGKLTWKVTWTVGG